MPPASLDGVVHSRQGFTVRTLKMFPWGVLDAQFQAFGFTLKSAFGHSPLLAQSKCCGKKFFRCHPAYCSQPNQKRKSASRLLRWRTQRGWSREESAAKLGVSRRTLQEICRIFSSTPLRVALGVTRALQGKVLLLMLCDGKRADQHALRQMSTLPMGTGSSCAFRNGAAGSVCEDARN
jgi:DNA-binding XRE family transcriptional regulator